MSICSIKKHQKVCLVSNCKQCNKLIDKSKIFCSYICSGLYNNKHSEKLLSRKKIQTCLNCNKYIHGTGVKYCNNKCQGEYEFKENINKWLTGEISGTTKHGHASYVKRYLLQKYNNSCAQCGWSVLNKHTNSTPLEVHHIDGNPYNNNPSNVTILCPNCHSLTKTYKSANKNGMRKYRKKYYTNIVV